MTWPANKILRVLHALGTAALAQQIAAATGLTLEQVWDACETLVNRGLAQRTQRGIYTITDAGTQAIASGKEIKSGPQGPTKTKIYQGTFRERLWRAMRIERKNTIGGWLALICPDGADKKTVANAQKYICTLCVAGYITRLPGRQQGTALTSNGYTRYLLVINNGPLAPVVRRVKRTVYDPNTGETVQLPEVRHEP